MVMAETVIIGTRKFVVGAWYQGKQPKDTPRQVKTMCRQFLAASRQTVRFTTKTGKPGWTGRGQWLRWAGDEVLPP